MSGWRGGRASGGWLLLLAGAGCAPESGPSGTLESTVQETARESADSLPFTPASAAADATLTPLSGPELARRMSLDLRGTLPSAAMLDAVEQGGQEQGEQETGSAGDAQALTSALSAAREEILADPLIGERLVVLLGERWHTRVDSFLIGYTEYPALASDNQAEYRFERAVGEEPLRLMAQVAAQDRPWSEIVTADYTVGNGTLESVWPMACEAGESGDWRTCRYTDGRPAAGVLATNGLWWRYYSTLSNYNRGRAAAVSRLLLCEDYLARPVSFDSTNDNTTALVDAEGIEGALRANPYCMGCHSSLDPLAATFFGFWVANEYNAQEMDHYHAEREPLAGYLLGQEPALAGKPLQGLAHLGQQIAADPRFPRCAAESFAEALWRREVVAEDFDRIEGFRRDFVSGDGTIKPLLRAITASAVYQAGAQTDPAGAAEPTRRLMDLSLLASVLQDLSGFTWTYQGTDMLDSDTWGYRILGGGVDGEQVTRPQRRPGMTWMLTVQRVAEGFGLEAGDRVGSGLLAGVSAADQPGSAPFDAMLQELHWRFYARRADAAWLAEISALWSSVASREGPRAWGAVVSAMVQDPSFVSY